MTSTFKVGTADCGGRFRSSLFPGRSGLSGVFPALSSTSSISSL